MRRLVRINNIDIKGFRGFKSEFNLAPGGRSLLIYGPNGAGKSSVADAIEWFFKNKVEYLGGTEAGKLLESLKNTFLAAGDDSRVGFKFDEAALNADRSILADKKSELSAEYSNKSDGFKTLIAGCKNENIILRSGTLTGFIRDTQAEKLRFLSEIIGFAEVTKVKETLKKAYNEIVREIKNQKFDGAISLRQSTLIANINQNANNDAELISGVNTLIAAVKSGTTVGSIAEIEPVLKSIAGADSKTAAAKMIIINELKKAAEDNIANFSGLESSRAAFDGVAGKLKNELDNLNKIFIESLLVTGVDVLNNAAYTENKCPLCLQDIDKARLVDEIQKRIGGLGAIKAIKEQFVKAKNEVLNYLTKAINSMEAFVKKDASLIADAVFAPFKEKAGELINCAAEIKERYNIEITAVSSFNAPADISLYKKITEDIAALADSAIDRLKASAVDTSTDITYKILTAVDNYREIKKIEIQKSGFEDQRKNLALILEDFSKKQKESIDNFLKQYSTNINSIYQRLNPGEKNENFCLKPVLKDEDELIGLSLEFDFQNISTGSPIKYLSESHLNALGLAFFITAASAFNKNCGFIVLDDVMASFDEDHRKRFADMLMNGPAETQIIMTTHDRQWFDNFRAAAPAGWETVELK